MAKMKFKLDKQKIMDFLLQRGEIVALGLTGTIAALAVGAGLLTAFAGVSDFGSGTPEEAIQKAARDLDNRIKSSAPDPTAIAKADAKPPEWAPLKKPERFIAGGWFQIGLLPDSKRRNPIVLPVSTVVDAKVRDAQVDLVEGDYLRYYLEQRLKRVQVFAKDGPAAAPQPGQNPLGDLQPVALAEPRRIVVVSLAFPYKDQLAVFRKALRKDTDKDLFDSPDTTPRFLGFNVMRCEILPDGKATPWAPIYGSKDGAPVVSDPIKDVLNEALYDEQNPVDLADFIFPGLVTPLPQLAEGFNYPKLELTDLKAATPMDTATVPDPRKPQRGPMNPRGGGPGITIGPIIGPKSNNPQASAPVAKFSWLDYKKMTPGQQEMFASRFAGTVYPFDPYGTEPEKEQPAVPGGGPMLTRPAPTQPGTGPTRRAEPPSFKPERMPDKCLVRFFDVDVQVGKTYQYSVKVRMANPNFGKPDEVAFKALATIKELESPWALTPQVTVPADWHYYVVDQLALEPALKNRATRGTDLKAADKNTVAVQLHRWVDRYSNNGDKRTVGDWVVAERLLFHRGDRIARESVEVDMAEWNPQKSQFELAANTSAKKKAGGPRPAAPVTFDPGENTAPRIVDFVGGKRSDYQIGRGTVTDDGSLELLVLSPDGKLLVRQGRNDTDQDTPEGRERHLRYQAWRSRLDEIHRNTSPSGPNGGPGGGPGPTGRKGG